MNDKEKKPLHVKIERGPAEWLKAVFWLVLIVGLAFYFFSGPSQDQTWTYLDQNLKQVEGKAPEIGEDTALVGYLELSGLILDEPMTGGSVFDPQQDITPARVRRALNAYSGHQDLDALVIHLTSPGGSVPASDAIARLVKVFGQEEVPVYVYANSLLASGGYYMSAPAAAIYSAPQALVGSIGVIFQTVNVEKLAEEKLGVRVRIFKQGRYKDMGSPFRELSQEEEELIQEKVDQAYQAFLETILDNRELSMEELQKAATGEVFTGSQARERKLVDDVLHFDQLGQRLKQATGKQQLFYVSRKERAGLLQLLSGTRASSGQKIVNALGPLARFTLPSGTYYLMEQ